MAHDSRKWFQLQSGHDEIGAFGSVPRSAFELEAPALAIDDVASAGLKRQSWRGLLECAEVGRGGRLHCRLGLREDW